MLGRSMRTMVPQLRTIPIKAEIGTPRFFIKSTLEKVCGAPLDLGVDVRMLVLMSVLLASVWLSIVDS